MTTVLRVVAIVGSPTDPDQVLRTALEGAALADELGMAAGRPVSVNIISWVPSSSMADAIVLATSPQSPIDRFLIRLGALRLHAKLRGFPLGRVVNSLGPMDQSRVVWRAARRHESAMTTLQSADVVLAVDQAAVLTAWKLRRRNPSIHAYYGIASTLKVLAARSD